MVPAAYSNKFQFYLSSIKSRFMPEKINHNIMFQFYLSSIKSCRFHKSMRVMTVFQFYLSSIKSHTPATPRTNGTSFNSTLVQLKDNSRYRGVSIIRVSILP